MVVLKIEYENKTQYCSIALHMESEIYFYRIVIKSIGLGIPFRMNLSYTLKI